MARSTAVGSNTDPLIWIRHPSITRASAINRIHAAGWWVPVLVAAYNPFTTSSSSNAFHIGRLSVDARGRPDAASIANKFAASLDRSTRTLMAQSGQI
jgi:hypothetical protein